MRLRRSLLLAASLLLLVLGGFGGEEPQPFRYAVERLSGVPAGKAVLGVALKRFGWTAREDLLTLFRSGGVSRTDAVLTRHFNPKTGTEKREREVTIFLKEGQTPDELALDMAHELIHASGESVWDPYDPKLTPAQYVWTAIEGPGGEVDAVLAECKVAGDLGVRQGAAAERCGRYRGAGAEFDRERVVREFYRVGHWHTEIAARLGPELKRFPLLSDEVPRLISSTGKAPYPAALLREFDEVTEAACRNSRRRAEVTSARDPEFLSSRCAGVDLGTP